MINFALLGAGRIGSMHADLIASSPQAKLRYVYDTYQPAANELANKYGLVPDNHHAPNWDKIVIMDHVTIEKLMPLAKLYGPTPEQVNRPLPKEEIPRDSSCYLFQNALYDL